MRGDGWALPPIFGLSILFGVAQIPYMLLNGLSAQTPLWGRIVALLFPVFYVICYMVYVRRYGTYRNRTFLFSCAGKGSVLGGMLFAVPGVGVTIQQQAVGLPILNADVLIAQMWLGGSLVGLAAGHLYGRVEAEKRRLRGLLGATEKLMTGTDETSIAESTVGAAERILGLDTAGIYVPGDETTLEPLAITDKSVEFFGRVPVIESRDAIAWSVYDSGETVLVDDVREHPEAYNTDTPVRSEMFVPFGDYGVFLAASADVDAFDETDRVLAQLLVSNAEAALESTANEAKLRKREQKLERLQNRTRRLMYTETREETGQVAVEAARDVIGAQLNGLHLLNEAGDMLEAGPTTEAAGDRSNGSPDYHREHDEGSGDAVVWDVFETGEPLYIEDTHEYDPLTEEPLSRCLLLYPLGDHGVFIASSDRPNDFEETDQLLFELLSSALTSAFDRVEREQTLRNRENKLQQQRQRLTVLNRVLRHDIRTHTNVIMGRATQLREEIGDDPSLESIQTKSKKIVELSENARRVEQTIETSDVAVKRADLAEITATSVETLRSSTAVDVRVDSPDEAYCLSNGLVDVAIENVLRNAVEHVDSDVPVVEVDVTVNSDEEEVVIEIADEGPGIPVEERSVFERDEETKLVHSSGLGLWLVHWIVEDIGGAVRIEDREPHGTVVSLHLPQATTSEQSPKDETESSS